MSRYFLNFFFFLECFLSEAQIEFPFYIQNRLWWKKNNMYRSHPFDLSRFWMVGMYIASGVSQSLVYFCKYPHIVSRLYNVWLSSSHKNLTCPESSSRIGDLELDQKVVPPYTREVAAITTEHSTLIDKSFTLHPSRNIAVALIRPGLGILNRGWNMRANRSQTWPG